MKKVIPFAFAALLLTIGFPAEAHQAPGKISRIGFLSATSSAAIPAGLDAFRVCVSLDMWRVKPLLLSIDTPRENQIA
jgi:hypothetical protein